MHVDSSNPIHMYAHVYNLLLFQPLGTDHLPRYNCLMIYNCLTVMITVFADDLQMLISMFVFNSQWQLPNYDIHIDVEQLDSLYR
jgi:hypothetical protein